MDSGCIKPATESEALDILRSDGVRHRLSSNPESIQSGKPYIVNNSLLLILIHHTKDAVEAHIACPRDEWIDIHNSIDSALKFIEKLGYNQVYTNVSDHLKTTANLIKKHGFKQIQTVGREGIYLWVSKQH